MIENNREELNEQEDQNQPREKGKSGTSNRGFASMSPQKQREIASKGGRAAHEMGVAHQWSSDEARNAGRKGGQSVSQNRQHMAEIGRKGGQASRGGGRNKNQASDINATNPNNGPSAENNENRSWQDSGA